MKAKNNYTELRHYVLNTGRLMGRSGFDVAAWMRQHGEGGMCNDLANKAHAAALSSGAPLKQKECYNNAMICLYAGQSDSGAELRYIEGFALHPLGVPLQHAWNADSGGHLYDFTATLFWGDNQPAAWYGFEVPSDVIDEYYNLPEGQMLMQSPLYYYLQKLAENGD